VSLRHTVYGCIGSAPTPLFAIADLTDQPPLHADHSSIAEAHIAAPATARDCHAGTVASNNYGWRPSLEAEFRVIDVFGIFDHLRKTFCRWHPGMKSDSGTATFKDAA
jgi:hypothetical protein